MRNRHEIDEGLQKLEYYKNMGAIPGLKSLLNISSAIFPRRIREADQTILDNLFHRRFLEDVKM